MKTRLLIPLTALLCFTTPLAADTPVQEARNHLEHAIGLLNKKEEGAGKKRRTSIPNILSILSNTETRLNEVKKNKGTNVNAALEYVATAKTELEAAKSGSESEHLDKAEAALQEALKRVRKMAQINRAK
ncbi:hypothetical protein [Prosthecobacter sp.]|uniref:hypothetical protein n=1 Tax=Prosthecobacter sp. TaxID=1965333 RepID=UPI003783743D